MLEHLTIDGLRKAYGRQPALKDLTESCSSTEMLHLSLPLSLRPPHHCSITHISNNDISRLCALRVDILDVLSDSEEFRKSSMLMTSSNRGTFPHRRPFLVKLGLERSDGP